MVIHLDLQIAVPTLAMPPAIPPPPPLTNVDPSKIDEIRRTVYVGNLDSSVQSITLKIVSNKRIKLQIVGLLKYLIIM